MSARGFCQPCEDDSVIGRRYDIEHCKPQIARRGSDRLLIFDCSVSFANILDPTEWKTKIAAGEIFLSPCGNFTKTGSATQLLFEYLCGGNVTDCVTHTFQFQSPAAAEDYSDELWWCNFNTSISRYTVAPLYCKDDRIVLPKDLVIEIKSALESGGSVEVNSPGFNISLTEDADFVAGPNNKNGLWQFTGEIENDTNLISAEIPGLFECLAEAGA